jgi:hypothetical protein
MIYYYFSAIFYLINYIFFLASYESIKNQNHFLIQSFIDFYDHVTGGMYSQSPK